jgi:hypothetical protein
MSPSSKLRGCRRGEHAPQPDGTEDTYRGHPSTWGRVSFGSFRGDGNVQNDGGVPHLSCSLAKTASMVCPPALLWCVRCPNRRYR